MKKILIIDGHPNPQSFCSQLADCYKKGAKTTASSCKIIRLSELQFDPILHYGYQQRTELEPDLLNAQKEIAEANHLVFVYPTWWGTYPALLKGFFDRVFLPKYAFEYRKNSPFWDQLLKGKTARLIVTMDSPAWYYRLVFKSPGHYSMKKCILGFCGIKPVRITTLGSVKTSDKAKREKWMKKIEQLGSQQR